MSLEELAAGILLVGLIAYAIFGGADFGAGVWTALARGPRSQAQREALFEAMGPVWETNNVWLILVVVMLFSAFPTAFSDLFQALLIPLVVALVGIAFRGAAFVFRHFNPSGREELPATGMVFSAASAITPLAFGTAVGAAASGHVLTDSGETAGIWESWLQPFPLMVGVIALAMCAFLTSYYMLPRTSGELQEDFRRRAFVASVVLGGLTTLGLLVAYLDADALWDRIDDPLSLAGGALAIVAGVCSLIVLRNRWYTIAPPVAAAAVTLVIGAWGVAQHPYLILPGLTLEDAAAPDATLRAILIALPIGALILVPSLLLLFATFSREGFDEHSAEPTTER